MPMLFEFLFNTPIGAVICGFLFLLLCASIASSGTTDNSKLEEKKYRLERAKYLSSIDNTRVTQPKWVEEILKDS